MSEGFAVLMAAVISAFVAVIGLVITKEHKISEFRQQWIDGLRVDVSSLIGAVMANQIGHDIPGSYRDFQSRLKELQYRIELRFKIGDKTATPLLLAVSELVANGEQLNDPKPSHFIWQLTNKVKEEAQELLKAEWERVKKGEENYCQTLRFSKGAAIATFGILSMYLSVWIAKVAVAPFIGWMLSLFSA